MRALGLVSLLPALALAGPPSTELLYNAAGQNQSLASVGRLRASFQCTASLINPDGATDGSPAYALTAGHCISQEPYGVILDRAVNYTLNFNYFVDTRDHVVTVTAKRVVWSTMKGADLALLELDATLGNLRAKGLEGLALAAAAPRPGASLYWVGAPTSNIPPEQAFMRRGECTARGASTVIEALWLWHDEIPTDCPDVYASASGSPLFDRNTGMIVGVIGTGTSLSFTGGPDYDCYRDRPCAVAAGGPIVEPNTSYASPAAALPGCFDTAGGADLVSARCALDLGQQLTVDLGGRNAVQPLIDGQPARWDARLSGPFQFYAWKALRLGLGDCRDPAGYGPAVQLAAAPVIDAPVGTDEGHYLLCVIAGNSAVVNESWQPYRHATIRRKRLDSQPPLAAPEYEVLVLDAGYSLALTGSAPAVTMADIKRGPLAATNCEEPSGYRPALSVPTVVRRTDFPYRACIRYADDAGNAAQPLVFDFGPPALQPGGLRNGASLALTRTVAPGSLFQVDTLEVKSARLEAIDAAGAAHPIPVTEMGPEAIKGLIPSALAPGPALLRLLMPDGSSLSTNLEVAANSPGVFNANFAGFGPLFGYFAKPGLAPTRLATCPANSVYCTYQPVPLGGQDVDVVLYGTGFPRDLQTLSVGTEEAAVVFIGANRDWPGVDEIQFRLPPSFILRGYQRVSFGAAAAWLLLE